MKNMPYSRGQHFSRAVDNVVVTISKDGYKTYHTSLTTTSEETRVHRITLEPK